MKANAVQKSLRQQADPEKAQIYKRFFKTGPGEYGEGDVFIGVVVPKIRKVVKEFKDLPHTEILKLLKSKVHEDRMMALLVWVYQFQKGDEKTQTRIFKAYLQNVKYINNWDLVDVTVAHIVGAYLYERDKSILTQLSKSKDLWERRISIVATHYFIRQNLFKPTLQISKNLLKDEHDLIHKAVGWMLREVGKRDKSSLVQFLNQHVDSMPRTMLRYAIEKFSEKQRQEYLSRPRNLLV